MITGYHGTDTVATPHLGFCVAARPEVAADYATGKNEGNVVTEVTLDTDDLTVEQVDYDYDEAEPIIPDDCTADVVEYEDHDEGGHPHYAAMLLTDRAIAACTVVATTDADSY